MGVVVEMIKHIFHSKTDHLIKQARDASQKSEELTDELEKLSSTSDPFGHLMRRMHDSMRDRKRVGSGR